MSAPSRIAKIMVQSVDSVGNLTEFCRLAAKELSSNLKPKLDANNVRFIGIGFDDKFLKPFVDGQFFSGELYIDSEKQCYSALEYRRFGCFDLLKLLFTRKYREVAPKVKSKNIQGDLKGDGFQNGGALVIDKNGKLLLEYIQVDATDHIEANDVLKSLKIPLDD